MLNSGSNLIIVGISGVTCGGKTTTACELNKILPNSRVFSQDDYFLEVDDPRHTRMPELDHINFDVVTALDMEKMTRDVKDYVKKNKRIRLKTPVKSISANNIDCDVKKMCFDAVKSAGVHVIIVEGFCVFNYEPLRDIFDLKYYFVLDKEKCFERRVLRIYEPPDCPGYFEQCVWPEHLKQLEEVRESVENVTYFSESSKDPVETILRDIIEVL